MTRPAARNRKGAETGIILLQIDGLAHAQLQRSLANGRMPFLQRLIESRKYRLEPFYSGLPSTTPAVQAELFYGVPCVVPAIRFISRNGGEDCFMLNPLRVKPLAETLLRDHAGLLRGGSSYSNIFIGGASHARYCVETLEPRNLLKRMRPFETLWVFVQHLGKLARILSLALVEAGAALADMVRGIRGQGQLFQELKFVPSRIWLCVVLRELIRFWVKRDIRLGVPVICANFVGYDEHAHRRGPDSAFAHWSLTGIDGVLRDIVRKAQAARRRRYQVVIYSDHGQENVIPYQIACRRSLAAGLENVFATGPLAGVEISWTEEPFGQLFSFRRGRSFPHAVQRAGNRGSERSERIRVSALGPLGHIYLPRPLEPDQMAAYARRLVSVAEIPLVLYRPPAGEVQALNRCGTVQLPENSASVLGADHPCPEEVGRDLVRLVDHRDAGDFVISGWRSGSAPLSFPMENGAHGGPGSRECLGFLLLPDSMAGQERRRWRPSELRRAVLEALGRAGDDHG